MAKADWLVDLGDHEAAVTAERGKIHAEKMHGRLTRGEH